MTGEIALIIAAISTLSMVVTRYKRDNYDEGPTYEIRWYKQTGYTSDAAKAKQLMDEFLSEEPNSNLLSHQAKRWLLYVPIVNLFI